MSLPMTPTDNSKTKTKTKTKKNKDKILKRPNMSYIFEKLRVQGYQIKHPFIISVSSGHHQCVIRASSVHHQCIISASQDKTRPH